MVSCKGAHFVQDIILTCVRWSVAYPLSYRHIAELMQERGVSVDHATVHRWVLNYSLPLGEACHRRKRPVGISWRMDETYRYCWRTRGMRVHEREACERTIEERARRCR
jgi:putative transposase